ncbi:MAG: GNAT family N-acetyltransferase [Acidimicrobiales bacterium]
MRVEVISQVTGELVEAFARLVPQLSKSNPPPTERELAAIVASRASVLFLAYDEDDEIVGSLTLVLFRIPTGLRAWIEDVVVDESARGKGVAHRMNEAAIDYARKAGAKTVDLTSRPSRDVANRLYQRLGFEKRDTNVYRYVLDGSSGD